MTLVPTGYRVSDEMADSVDEPALSPAHGRALNAAFNGWVEPFQLPLLASGSSSIANWAAWQLHCERAKARQRRSEVLLAAGYDPSARYYGILDSDDSAEVIAAVVRSSGDHADPHVWNGQDWQSIDTDDIAGEQFVVLDADVLADVLDSEFGSLLLNPATPIARLEGKPAPIPQVLFAAGNIPDHSDGVMIAWMVPPEQAEQLAIEDGQPADDLHCTLFYCGKTDEVDEAALNEAVAQWAATCDPMSGEISGNGMFETDDGPVQYASVDVPGLNEARSDLLKVLQDKGIKYSTQHGFTPHVSLIYGDTDVNVDKMPIDLSTISVVHGTNRNDYELGQPALAASASPDIVYAIVDEFDNSAVLDLIRVVPGPHAYRRTGGKWILDDTTLHRLLGVDPPAIVEVTGDQAQSVIDQVDAYDTQHPKKPEPVTAAMPWEEDKHKRAADGRFGSKPGQDSSSGASAPAINKQSVSAPSDLQSQKADVQFAKQGLAELRRRNIFDRQIVGLRERLLRSGVKPGAADRAVKIRVEQEKQLRELFRTNRADAAQIERIRRMSNGLPKPTAPAQDYIIKNETLPISRLERHKQELRAKTAKARAAREHADLKELSDEELARYKQARKENNHADSLWLATHPEKKKPVTADASMMPAKLKKYWLGPQGRAKIRWGTSGDFNRCRRHLAKYLRPDQVSGACANLHHLATGQWPGKGRHH